MKEQTYSYRLKLLSYLHGALNWWSHLHFPLSVNYCIFAWLVNQLLCPLPLILTFGYLVDNN